MPRSAGRPPEPCTQPERQSACTRPGPLLGARSYRGAADWPAPANPECGRGGTGRRATLRSLWAKARGSSSLLDRTIPFLSPRPGRASPAAPRPAPRAKRGPRPGAVTIAVAGTRMQGPVWGRLSAARAPRQEWARRSRTRPPHAQHRGCQHHRAPGARMAMRGAEAHQRARPEFHRANRHALMGKDIGARRGALWCRGDGKRDPVEPRPPGAASSLAHALLEFEVSRQPAPGLVEAAGDRRGRGRLGSAGGARPAR